MITIEVNSVAADARVILAGLSFCNDCRTLLISGDVASGKTLLARAICGDFVDSEWIRVDGHAKLGDAEIRFGKSSSTPLPSRVGYMPQSAMAFFVANSVTGEMLASQLCSANGAEQADTRLAKWRKESPVSDKGGLSPLALSGGQQRLFMLENVLSTAPDHLIIDGGMVSLDDDFRARAAFLIREWMAEDPRRTFICLSSHAEQSWFDFEQVLSLPRRRASRSAASRPKTAQRPEVGGEEVLAFRRVSAGPMVAGRRLLRDVSFSLSAGSYVGLKGPNGIGKTTLLRLVAGVSRPTKGEVYFRGAPLPKVIWPGLKDGIAYLPQEPELAGPMLAASSKVASARVAADDAKFWQEFFDLDWSGDAETYWSMSSGERARATLMSQAMSRPSLWILDEPTFRVEAEEMGRFLAALRDVREDTCAVIVSHDDLFLNAVAEHQYVLSDSGVHAASVGASSCRQSQPR